MTIAIPIIVTLVTVILIVAFRPVAQAIGLVDRPGGRKRHVGDIPIIGGIAMFLAVAVGIVLMPGLGGAFYLLLLAGGLLVVVGLIDDRFGLPATVRLVAQLSAVLIMVFGAGLIMTDIGDPLWMGRVELGPLALVVTALIFMSVINAFNTIDGLDGLAGCMALIAVLSIALVSANNAAVQSVALIIAATIVGYLGFNLPYGELRPFRVFMGDAGSTFLGITIVWLMVGICQGTDRIISPVHGLWFAALPIYDLFSCFVRRTRMRRSPFDPGRDHFHHILRDAGMGVPLVVATLVGLQSLYAMFGIASFYWDLGEPAVFTVWAIVGIGQLYLIRSIANFHMHMRPNSAT